MEPTIAEGIAGFVSSLSYEDIPAPVIEKAKDLVLDTLGVCAGSAGMDFGRSALQLVAGWGGVEESTLIGSATRVPAHAAAFANGILGHGQDFDDTHTESVVHPSACLVPVALAVAERYASSGKEVLTAFVAGMEVMIRLGLPALNRIHLRGFHTTSICGTFAAAVITAKLAGRGRDGIVDALGIGGSFTSGLLECIPSGSSAKRLHAGWAGLCGVVAADTARLGFTGPKTVFEGRLGVYHSLLRSEVPDLSDIVPGLGRDWEILNVRPKLYPCCHYLQSFLDCAARLRGQHRIDPSDIRRIHCRVAQGCTGFVCEPWDKKLQPQTSYEARFSLPFAVALMLIEGKAGAAQFADAFLAHAGIAELMRKVTYEVEPSFQVKDMPGWITVTLNDGTSLEARIDRVRGDTASPVARSELLGKFSEATIPLARERTQRIAEKVFQLDRLNHVRELMQEFLPYAPAAQPVLERIP